MSRSVCVLVSIGLLVATAPAETQVATDVQCTSCVGDTDLATNSVTTNKIANGGVRNADLGANSVTSGKIKDGNVNFADLSTEVQAFMGGSIATISTVGVSGSDSFTVAAACPSDRIAISASCTCDDNGGTTNDGVLHFCGVAGNAAIATCYEDAITYNPLLAIPFAQVQVLCLGAVSADGTPWLPTASGLVPASIAVGKDSDTASSEVAEWQAAQHAAFESKLAEMKKKAVRRGQMVRQ